MATVFVPNQAAARRHVINLLVEEYRVPESNINILEVTDPVENALISKLSYSVKVKVVLRTSEVKEHQFAVHVYSKDISVIY